MDWFEQGIWNAKGMLKSYALKLYGNVDDADDAVQDTLMRAIANRHSFQEGSNLQAWLSVILKNAFLGSRRKGRHQRMVASGLPDDYAFALTAPDDPHKTLEAVQAIDLTRKLRARGASLLRYASGFEYHEIAEAEGVAEGTVKSRVYRARAAMREMVAV